MAEEKPVHERPQIVCSSDVFVFVFNSLCGFSNLSLQDVSRSPPPLGKLSPYLDLKPVAVALPGTNSILSSAARGS
jgi:hypothetical protein